MAQKAQTIIFNKEQWSPEKARSWLNDHDFRSDKMDETEQSYRFRQFDPSECQEGSFQTLTENFPEGISAVVCDRKEADSMAAGRGKIERRCGAAPVLRQADGQPPVIHGYAAIFNEEADIFWFREMVVPGAFTRAIEQRQDVRALFNHDPSLILGRTGAETLRIGEDDRGLWYEIDPPDTQLGRDLVHSIRRGDISQSSFAFVVITEEVIQEKDQKPLRVIKDVDLFDVSPVTYPAYESTNVSVRALFPEGVPAAVSKLGLRAGAVLNRENKQALEEALGHCSETHSRIQDVLESAAKSDKHDPCDPNDPAYDPAKCQEMNQAAFNPDDLRRRKLALHEKLLDKPRRAGKNNHGTFL